MEKPRFAWNKSARGSPSSIRCSKTDGFPSLANPAPFTLTGAGTRNQAARLFHSRKSAPLLNGDIDVPTSSQYPLDRHRALERRWRQLLERTRRPKEAGPGRSARALIPLRLLGAGQAALHPQAMQLLLRSE